MATHKGYAFFAFAAQRLEQAMQPYLFVARRGAVQAHALQHAGEEFVDVLAGEMDYRVGAVTYHLAAGDALYFNADEPHDLTPVSARVDYLAIMVEGSHAACNDAH
jgi:uncharacterized cupin superfamily protein